MLDYIHCSPLAQGEPLVKRNAKFTNLRLLARRPFTRVDVHDLMVSGLRLIRACVRVNVFLYRSRFHRQFLMRRASILPKVTIVAAMPVGGQDVSYARPEIIQLLLVISFYV